MHKMVDYCSAGKHIATEFCPEETIKRVAVLDYDREIIENMRANDHIYLLKYLNGSTGELSKICPVHDKAPEPDPPEPPTPGGDDTPTPGGDDTPAPPPPPTPPPPDGGIDDPDPPDDQG